MSPGNEVKQGVHNRARNTAGHLDSFQPFLTPATLQGFLNGDATSHADCDWIQSDIIRAAISRTPPLFGIANVAATLADAFMEESLTLSCCASFSQFRLFDVLANVSRDAPNVPLTEKTFSDLCRRCVISCSAPAARCATALAYHAWEIDSAKSRVKALLLDLLVWNGQSRKQACFVASLAMLKQSEVSLFSIESRHGDHDVLELAVLLSLRDLSRHGLPNLKTTSLGGPGEHCEKCAAEMHFGFEKILKPCVLHESSLLPTLQLSLLSKDLSPSDISSLQLVLQIESCRRSAVSSYEDLLVGLVWPAVSKFALGNNPQCCSNSLGNAEQSNLRMSCAFSAVGVVLGTMSWDHEDSAVWQGCAVATKRLLDVLECDDVPAVTRVAAGYSLIRIVVLQASGTGNGIGSPFSRLSRRQCESVLSSMSFLESHGAQGTDCQREEQNAFLMLLKAN